MAIYNLQGHPEVPGEVVRRLRAQSPDLGLVWMPVVRTFAVTRDWRADDPRRKKAQQGDLDPAKQYDVVSYLPEDCTADDAAALIEREFRRPMTADEIDTLVDGITAQNDRQVDANLEAASASVMDDVESIVGRRLTNTASNLDTARRGRKRAK